MTLRTVLKRSMGAAALAIGALMVATPASAIVVSGSWDPKYGSPFEGDDSSSTDDDMWWSGSALYFIPDSCLIPAGGMLTAATCAGMSVTSATVDLRLGQNGTLLSTLQFSAPAAVSTVGFDLGGNVSYVVSDWFNPLQQGSGSTFSLSSYFFSLSFSEDGAELFHVKDDAFLDKHGGHGPDEKTFFWYGQGNGHIGDLCGPTTAPSDGDYCGFSDTPGTMVFAPIPEPSTYALMLAGLAAIGFMARRRRQG